MATDLVNPEASDAAALGRRTPTTAAEVQKNWHLMSAIFGINHGCATIPLIFATSLLDPNVGYAGSALLYVFTCLSSLFLSVPTVGVLGPRGALLFGMLVYSLYVASFAVAAGAPMGSWVQWLSFLPGSAFGGLAASVLWTSQGSYMDRHATALVAHAGSNLDRQTATSSLAATFGVYYLLFEVVCKLLSSFALKYKVVPWIIFTVCLFVAFTSGATCVFLWDARGTVRGGAAAPAGGAPAGEFTGKLLKAASLWKDPTIWLLSLTNLTFGFAAAFMNGYVNASFTKKQLGADVVGFFATATALMGALASHAFGAASRRLGSKGPIIFTGSLCFLAIPAIVLLFGDGLNSWGYGLIVPYLLQGCGRGVYESTNKGVFADFFPGAQAEGAFANSMMQTTLSFAFCFFFSSLLPREALAGIVVVLAAATFPCYLQARRLRRRSKAASGGEAAGGGGASGEETESTATTSSLAEDVEAAA